MARDVLYYFDKETLEQHELGEVQKGFNMSFVLDGTKDSAKVIIHSYSANIIEPYTIVYHNLTSTWWIVSSDKVDRLVSEEGYLYIHNLKLEGAIELLNARDLTDCAFFQDKYTITEFVERLFKLSTFEFTDHLYIEQLGNAIDLNEKVDYIKTYENYTLLSALRDFFDGYNASVKLMFSATIPSGSTTPKLDSATLMIYPKTGTSNLPLSGDRVFNIVKETRTNNKNSFGTTVISNADNVSSSRVKTYPIVGTAKLSSNAWEITSGNAILRLPSNIFEIEKLVVYKRQTVRFRASKYGQEDKVQDVVFSSGGADYVSKQYDKFYDIGLTGQDLTTAQTWLTDNKAKLVKLIDAGLRSTLFKGVRYNPTTKDLEPPQDNPNFYFPYFYRNYAAEQRIRKIFLATKDVKDAIDDPYQAVAYERGKNYIDGFDFIDNTNLVFDCNSTDLYYYANEIVGMTGTTCTIISAEVGYWIFSIEINYGLNETTHPEYWSFVVDYLPMSDLKIKYDNDNIRIDSQMYNQNGKFNDSSAFSKQLISYAKEITSENITKYVNGYANEYDAGLIQGCVGMPVNIDNEIYVVNNLSVDFYENENEFDSDSEQSVNVYYCVAEVSLSKKIAVKSALVSPNTNIRDYGIPQKNTIKRKQLFRDFYELGYSVASDSDLEWKLPIYEILNVTNKPKKYNDHVVMMQMTYKEPIGGGGTLEDNTPVVASNKWWYQLNTSVYVLKKAVYEVVDFQDNNIIGYDIQSIYSGFDVSRLFSGLNDNLNTPISYTDDNGEVKDIRLAFCTPEQVYDIWDTYQSEQTGGDSYNGSLYNSVVFIPQYVFNLAYGNSDVVNNGYAEFTIALIDYNKDPLEIPFFEYVCQIDDSNEIEIGENILDSNEDDVCYLYGFRFIASSLGYSVNSAKSLFDPTDVGIITNSDTSLYDEYIPNNGYQLSNSVVMQFGAGGSSNKLNVIFYNSIRIMSNGRLFFGNLYDITNYFTEQWDLAIARYTINKKSTKIRVAPNQQSANMVDCKVDVMFLCKNIGNATALSNSQIKISTNHYKVK